MFNFNLVWNFRISSFFFRFYHSITYHCYYYSFQGSLNFLFIIIIFIILINGSYLILPRIQRKVVLLVLRTVFAIQYSQ